MAVKRGKAKTPVSTCCELVKTQELARILGLSTSMIHALVKEGLPKVSHGTFDTAVAVQWYIQTWRDRAEGGREGNLWDEKKKQIIAQTKKTELENAKLREEHLEVTAVSHVLNEVAVIVSTQLDGLGARTSGILAGISEPAKIQSILFDETRTIRAAIARSIEDFAAIADDGEDSPPPAKKKRRTVGKPKPDSTAGKPRTRAVSQ